MSEAEINGIAILYAMMTGFFAGIGLCVLGFSAYIWYHQRQERRMAEAVREKEYLH